MNIGIDFDGVVVDAAGRDMNGAETALKALMKNNDLYLNSSRTGQARLKALEWFANKRIRIVDQSGRKPDCDIYLDDRSLYGLPKTKAGSVDWPRIVGMISARTIKDLDPRTASERKQRTTAVQDLLRSKAQFNLDQYVDE